jgi:hypothetical protein
VPQDFNPDPFVKSVLADGEFPKVDKPLSPQAERTALDSLKPTSPKGVHGSPGVGSALTSSTRAASGQDLRTPP